MHVLVPLTFMPLLGMLLSRLPVASAAIISLAAICGFGAIAAAEFARLTQRLRWIWLSLLVIYSCLTPGEYIFPASPMLGALTYEGMFNGANQALHLLAMLSLIAYVLRTYSASTLVSGLYQCLAAWHVPRTWLTPAIVRTCLVLQAQTLVVTQHSHRTWQAYFQHPEKLVASAQELPCIEMQLYPLGYIERALVLLQCAAMVALVFA